MAGPLGDSGLIHRSILPVPRCIPVKAALTGSTAIDGFNMNPEKQLKAIRKTFKDFKTCEVARILRDDIPTFMEFPLAKRPEDLALANAAFLGSSYEGVK